MQHINIWKLLVPLTIGISVSVYLFIAHFNYEALRAVTLNYKLLLGLLLAGLTVICRDFAFMYKIRLSAGNHMSWSKTFQTIIMWEFGACISPKVAEAPFVLFVLKRSGLSYGKSVAVYMLNAFFDNAAFIAIVTVVYLFLGGQMLKFSDACPDLAGHPVMQSIRHFADIAWVGYVLIFCAAVFLGTALFVLPVTAKKIFYRLASFSFLKRFKNGITHLADEIEITAAEFKNQPVSFWLKMSTATLVNWLARFLLGVVLLYAFAMVDFSLLLALARQLALWIFMGIPATPGASGVAEVSFMALHCDLMPAGLGVAIALLWRMYSYYLYLILGMIVLPKWAKQMAAENEA